MPLNDEDLGNIRTIVAEVVHEAVRAELLAAKREEDEPTQARLARGYAESDARREAAKRAAA